MNIRKRELAEAMKLGHRHYRLYKAPIEKEDITFYVEYINEMMERKKLSTRLKSFFTWK